MDEEEPSRRGPLIALIGVVLLIVVGLFVAHEVRSGARIQDCVMEGRTNCAPVPTSR